MKSVPNYVKLVPNELSILNDVPYNPIIINNIPNIFIVLFVVLSCRFGVEAQHAAPHNDVSHNPITINNIPNIFIVLFVVFSCRDRMEAQHAAPLLTFPISDGELIFSVKSVPN